MYAFALASLVALVGVAALKARQPTPAQLIDALTVETHWTYPKLPRLSTPMRGRVANEIVKSDEVRAAFTQLDVKHKRNTDWFAGLVALERAKAVWSLQACLCHPHDDVQIKALEALRRLDDKRAVPFLILYAEYMAVHEAGSENATLHGIIHTNIGKTLSSLTGKEVTIEGQDVEKLNQGIVVWRRWQVRQERKQTKK